MAETAAEQQIKELNIQIATISLAASNAYAEARKKILALTAQRDALLDKQHVANTWDSLSDNQKATFKQFVAAAGSIASGEAVGKPGA
jgi:hypothetical protein